METFLSHVFECKTVFWIVCHELHIVSEFQLSFKKKKGKLWPTVFYLYIIIIFDPSIQVIFVSTAGWREIVKTNCVQSDCIKVAGKLIHAHKIYANVKWQFFPFSLCVLWYINWLCKLQILHCCILFRMGLSSEINGRGTTSAMCSFSTSRWVNTFFVLFCFVPFL